MIVLGLHGREVTHLCIGPRTLLTSCTLDRIGNYVVIWLAIEYHHVVGLVLIIGVEMQKVYCRRSNEGSKVINFRN